MCNCQFIITADVDQKAENQLLYHQQVADTLVTSDESDLSVDCSMQYGTAWESEVASMMDTVNQRLEEGLCEENTAAVLTYTGSLSAFGAQVGC